MLIDTIHSHKSSKKLKGYSFIEVLVSLTIIGITTIVMFNFIILGFRLTTINLGRSLVREELANVINLIGKDFRSADSPPTCSSDGTSCNVYLGGILHRWSTCNNSTSFCRDYFNKSSGLFANSYTTSSNAKITYVKFETGFAASTLQGSSNLIFTISAAHSNDSLEINNVIKQASFSIRNYTL